VHHPSSSRHRSNCKRKWTLADFKTKIEALEKDKDQLTKDYGDLKWKHQESTKVLGTLELKYEASTKEVATLK
jgi:hypothetical protein